MPTLNVTQAVTVSVGLGRTQAFETGVQDVPEKAARWMLRNGYGEEVEEPTTEPVTEEKPKRSRRRRKKED